MSLTRRFSLDANDPKTAVYSRSFPLVTLDSDSSIDFGVAV